MKNKNNRRAALVYHAKPKPGKIEVVPTTKYSTQRDLALAYSPGVAYPCLEIENDKNNVYKYTAKGNLVAVITNGTAVLGLGDIGPEASKPVMEGKGLLFKIFAGIDVFDIEIDASDTEKFIETVKRIAPTFGGINLEDIKAPEAFEIEKRLVKELDIPVMHDDQHGTAIISAAALLNALELADKKIDDVKVVVCGAGAAAISCTRMYKALGLKKKNIIMTDSKGVITTSRKDLSKEKAEFATKIEVNTLEEAMKDSDVFIGLSKANMVTPKMLLSMASNPIVFAMANPDPEIDYALAMKTRDDIIMATGRSDHPNQVNNVLGFPYIFRGALDVKATKINDEMKMAAALALAAMTKETVPEFVNIAYDKTKLTFGKNYIIPKPFDPRLITEIPPMVAKAAMDSGVAREPIQNWEQYEEELHSRLFSDKKMVRVLFNRAKENPKKIVFAEADHLDVLKAAQIVHEEGIGFPVLLGNIDTINDLKSEIEFDAEVPIIDPKCDDESENRERYGKSYWNKRKRKGVTLYDSIDKMKQRNYYAGMMLSCGDVDALISGYSRSYPVTFKPIIETIGKAKGIKKVATTNLMITSKGPLFFSDTSINIEPSSKELAIITKMTSETVRMFGIKPVIAMVSYSNFGSNSHPSASKVNDAVKYLHKYYPELDIDGEIQTDFALNREMLKDRFGFSKLSGKKVNTLIFPNLDSANTNYKLVKELDKALSIGPIMMGMSKAAHITQLGASVDEIVNMSALAVVDAQKKIKLGFMITHIKGRLVEKSPTELVIDCNGIGYLVNISLNTFSLLSDSEAISLYTHLQVKEDSHTLFGFFDKSERNLFRKLISVSGIGASTARTMLSSLNPQEIQRAILTENVSTIQSVKGIGLKTAQRVIIELKDKVNLADSTGEISISGLNQNREEALSALEVLGYSRKQTSKVVDELINNDPEISVEKIIKNSLNKL